MLIAGVGISAWLLTRDTDRNGAESPALAVESFLQAVYTDRDPAAAAALVCSESRDEDALSAKIEEVRSYEQTEVNPQFSWTDPTVVEENGEVTVVMVTVTLVTDEEKTSDQTLQVSVLDKESNGWWICDMETVEDTSAPGESPESPAPESPAVPASSAPEESN